MKALALLMSLAVAGCVASEAPPLDPPAASSTDTPADTDSAAVAPVAAAPAIGPVPAGKGRIVVFRGNTFGLGPNLTIPKIRLDDAPVGNCKHTEIIVRDLAPGTYRLSIQTDIVANEMISLAEGQVVYVKCNVLPIGILLPAPTLEIVTPDKVPEKVTAGLRP